MSLTSHLKQPQSPVRRFLLESFPNTGALVGQARKQLIGIPTIRPDGSIPYGTIGTALDYRLRYYFALTPIQELVAWEGAAQLCGRPRVLSDGVAISNYIPNEEGEPMLSQELIDEFFTGLAGLLDCVQPPRKKLEIHQEELIARYCIVLALFEEVFRAHVAKSPLYNRRYDTVTELLAITQPHWLTDLCNLSWLFYDRFSYLLASPAVLNPIFDGSKDIGGADADLILDGYLLDIKTTLNPRVDPQWLYQLIGYVLLDFSDSFQLQGVGLYLARQGLLLKWPLYELIQAVTGGRAASLMELRSRFRELLQGMQKERQEAKRKWQEQEDRRHRSQRVKWAREVARRWSAIDAQKLTIRQRKSLERARKFLEQNP